MGKPIIRIIGEGIYDVDIHINGRRIRRRFSRRTCKGISPKTAAEKYAEEMRRVAGIHDSRIPAVELRDYILLYLRWAETEKAKRTVRNDRGRLHLFLHWAEKNEVRYLSDITPAIMDRFRDWYLIHRGRNPNNYISIIQALMNHAVRSGRIQRNPIAGYKKIKPLVDEGLKYFSTSEVRAMLSALPRPFPFNFYLLLLHTGMRPDEMINLEIRSLDIESRIITIESRNDHPTKTRRTRYIPMTDEAYAVCVALLKNRAKQERYLFDKGDGHPLYLYNWYSRYLKRLCATLNIPREKARLHTFRHTFATKLLESGVKMYIVSDFLGHYDVRTTLNTYGHLEPEYRKQIRRLSY